MYGELHFHGLDDEQWLVGLDLLAGLHQQLPDIAADIRSDGMPVHLDRPTGCADLQRRLDLGLLIGLPQSDLPGEGSLLPGLERSDALFMLLQKCAMLRQIEPAILDIQLQATLAERLTLAGQFLLR